MIVVMMTTNPTSTPNTYADERSFYLFRMLQSLRQSIRAIDMHSKKLAADHKITSPQLVCLSEINTHPKVSISELARFVHLSPSTVVGIVDRLEEKNLVEKVRNDKDRRRVDITITPRGKTLIDDAPTPFQEEFASAFSALPTDEQLQLVQAFEKVVDLMNARNIDAAPMLETGPLDYPHEVKQALWDTAELAQQKNIEQVQPDQRQELKIRRAREEDKPTVVSFINSSTEWYRSLIDEADIGEHEVDIHWATENFERREFYVGFEGDTPVGTVTLQFFGDYTYLGYVYVDTNHVGKAYGKQLLEFAKEESIRRGKKGMVLIAHPKATWAIKAYQKYGFELLHRDKDEILAWNDGALKPYYEDYFMLFLYPLEGTPAQ